MRKLILFLSISIICVCQSEKPATGKILADLQNQCIAYGFTPGTDAYSACVYQMDQNRIAQNRDRRIEAANALQHWGDQMQENARTQAILNAQRRTITCTTSTGYYVNITTTCQ